MRIITFIVRVLVLAAVTAAFFGFPLCWAACKIQGLVWGAAATLLFGRFFCEAICPLGILQSFVNWIFHPRSHVRRVCTRLPETRVQRIVRWSVVAALAALAGLGLTGPAFFVTPYSVFGKTLALWWPGLIVFGIVMALSVFGKGRIWCNWICPFGTVYNLVARITPCKNKVGRGCGNCRACFAAGTEKKAADEDGESGVTRREALHGAAMLAVAEKLTDGGYAPVSLPGSPERAARVLPPGAGDRRKFALKCVGCQLCVVNCPGDCLKPSMRLADFGQPEMDFRGGYCRISCRKCGEVCPEGAIAFLQHEMRPNVHMGCATWKRDLCIRTTEKVECTACIRKCPLQAIHLVKGFPVIDRDKCIGCGACEHVCPSRPMPAIYVEGYEVQKMIRPMAEEDLLAEMKVQLDAGAAAVVARDGVIAAREEGRGIAPLMRLMDAGSLRGALLMDKVIGRAAAAICIVGGVRKVVTPLAGEGAVKLLESRGVTIVAGRTVPQILNRDRSDTCPMEKAVSDCDDPVEMVERLRKEMKK